jgi:hypothetical protein
VGCGAEFSGPSGEHQFGAEPRSYACDGVAVGPGFGAFGAGFRVVKFGRRAVIGTSPYLRGESFKFRCGLFAPSCPVRV